MYQSPLQSIISRTKMHTWFRDRMAALRADYNDLENAYYESCFVKAERETVRRQQYLHAEDDRLSKEELAQMDRADELHEQLRCKLADHDYVHVLSGRTKLFIRHSNSKYVSYEDITDSNDPNQWRCRVPASLYSTPPQWLEPTANGTPWQYNPLKGLLYDPHTATMHEVSAEQKPGEFDTATVWMLRSK
jgi:hypothetical protein